MRTSREQPKHPGGIIGIPGFSQNGRVDNNRGVSAENDSLRALRPDDSRLREREPGDVVARRFVRVPTFIYLRVNDVKPVTGAGQQFGTPGRSGCKYE